MLIGQLVAISVASNLFYLAVLLHAPTSSGTRQASHAPVITVWLPILYSLRTIYDTPAASGTSYFLPNLLIMHALLIIPLVAKTSPALPAWSSTRHLYAVAVAVSLYIRGRTLLPLIPPSGSSLIPSVDNINTLLDSLIGTLYSHPAQSSIGFDVVWTTVSFLAWCLFDPNQEKGILTKIIGALFMLPACLIVSVGVVAPAHLIGGAMAPPEESNREGEKGMSAPSARESWKRVVGSSGDGVWGVDASNVGIVNEISGDI